MLDCQTSDPNMDHFMEILEENAWRDMVPLKGTFELTARCNFDCCMCYVHLNEEQIRGIGRELTNEEWLAIAKQARDAGMLYLTLTGGEVFARPHFRELYEALAQMGFLITILSNGSLIDEAVIEWLKECPPFALRFTLYGASDETYEAVCGIKKGFTRVSHAIDLVLEAGIPLYTVGTVIRENEQDLEETARFAAKKGISFAATTSVLKSVRGADRDVEAHRFSLAKPLEKQPLYPIEQFEQKNEMKHLLERCRSYRTSFWITWNGDLVLCAFMKQPAVSLRQMSFPQAWSQLNTELLALYVPEACVDCRYAKFCIRCPGILSAECGSCSSVTEEFCENAKKLYDMYHEKEGLKQNGNKI